MFYRNARIYCDDHIFRMGAFEVKDGLFGEILPAGVPDDAVDLRGATVIPGLVDIHIHGAAGADLSDGEPEGLRKMARYLASRGVTSFTPASMTLPRQALEKAFSAAGALYARPADGYSRLMGIHMEGPYFSEKRKGAQNPAYLKEPDFDEFFSLFRGCGGLVRIVDIAPERPGAEEFIRRANRLCTVSVAHTDSGYETAKAAFAAGASHVTHLFNAMPGIHHREPGVIPAAWEAPGVSAEIICDGHHVHPAVVRMAFAAFGAERMILISDAGRCCGMDDGSYEQGGQTVFLKDGIARLADGTIASSATDLYGCMRKAMAFGIREEDALRCATINPARAIGRADRIGSITTGKIGDFLICSPDYAQKRVFLAGREVPDF